MFDNDISPLFEHKHTEEPVFLPGNMLEAARIQKNLPPLVVPEGCLLDFDGELVDFLVAKSKAKLEPSWPCFHTRLYLWHANGTEYGIIGGTVGASFAVLVAEELFARSKNGSSPLGGDSWKQNIERRQHMLKMVVFHTGRFG